MLNMVTIEGRILEVAGRGESELDVLIYNVDDARDRTYIHATRTGVLATYYKEVLRPGMLVQVFGELKTGEIEQDITMICDGTHCTVATAKFSSVVVYISHIKFRETEE
jgi:hypothetical protein